MYNVLMGIGVGILVLSIAAVALMMGIAIWHVMWGEYKINRAYRNRDKLSNRVDE